MTTTVAKVAEIRVEAVKASAIYQRVGTEERQFSRVTTLDDQRGPI